MLLNKGKGHSGYLCAAHVLGFGGAGTCDVRGELCRYRVALSPVRGVCSVLQGFLLFSVCVVVSGSRLGFVILHDTCLGLLVREAAGAAGQDVSFSGCCEKKCLSICLVCDIYWLLAHFASSSGHKKRKKINLGNIILVSTNFCPGESTPPLPCVR